METQQRSATQQPDDDVSVTREEDLKNPLTPWWRELAVALLGATLWLPTIGASRFPDAGSNSLTLAVAALVIVSAICYRKAPGVGLILVWIAFGSTFLLTYFTFSILGIYVSMHYAFLMVGITAFGTARYGSRIVVRLSGVSIAMVGGLLAVALGLELLDTWTSASEIRSQDSYAYIIWQYMSIPLLIAAILVVPWLVGLLLRSRAKAAESEELAAAARSGEARAQADRAQANIEREQAREIATLRADQARMSREVHDVVGHSLAVVLAQAESAQFLPDDSTQEHKRVVADIAKTARQALQDVRAVLGATRDGVPVAPIASGGMDALVTGVRSAGTDVRSSVVGIPRPLPPERDAVAYRVLQEMLTNALRHGERGEPITVERHWDGQLRIEVTNTFSRPQAENTGGTGVEGMARRLESVGGHLDVRRRNLSGADESDATRLTYTATAWLPLES